jgi:hypothetical protein
MLIILFDHSSSMGEPFRGTTKFAGRSVETQERVKLDAGKSALLERLGAFQTGRLALFEFTSTASKIFDGPPGDRTAIRAGLDGLVAQDGTNIASALDEAHTFASQAKELRLRILVITDGLSALEPARAAAERLAALGATIDVLLIDPTAEGMAVAQAISIEGETQFVTSVAELAEGVEQAGTRQERWEKEAEAIDRASEEEARKASPSAASRERLAFTAGYPDAVSAGPWYTLLFYLHLEGLSKEVASFLRQQAATLGLRAPATAVSPGVLGVPRGTILRVVPRVEGVEFNPLSHEVAWQEDIEEVRFKMRAISGQGSTRLGALEVEKDGALLALVPLAVRVRRRGEAAEVEKRSVRTGRVFRRIFASYSTREDAAVVERCVAAYEALGIYVYLDKKSLRASSGLEWLPLLKKWIGKADLFQLYWSKAARDSKYVEQEWRHALSLTGGKGDRFIRPVRWKSACPDLPPELSHLQFAYLGSDVTAGLTGTAAREAAAEARTPADSSQLPVTVVPLVPGAPQEPCATVRNDVASAVAFLEHRTGLRYYPIPTLLVDNYTVRRVRSMTTTDLPDNQAGLSQRLLDLANVLNAVALAFHVKFDFGGKGSRSNSWDDPAFARDFGSGRLFEADAFSALKQYCEGTIHTAHSLIAVVEGVGLPELSPSLERQEREPFCRWVVRLIDHVRESPSLDPERFFLSDLDKATAELLSYDLSRAGLKLEPRDRDPQRVKLVGPDSSFVTVLTVFRDRLLTLGPEHDLCVAFAAAVSDPKEVSYQAILKALAPAFSKTVDPWAPAVTEAAELVGVLADTNWRKTRDTLAQRGVPGFSPGLDFPEFLSQFLKSVLQLLEFGRRKTGGFYFKTAPIVRKQAWDRVAQELGGSDIRTVAYREGMPEREEISLEGSLDEFIRIFREAGARLAEGVRWLFPFRSAGERWFATQVATYGIFIPARSEASDDILRSWAVERGVPSELTLPGTPRVLFCLDACQRFEEKCRSLGHDADRARALARDFQRCVLVHEHFHAILETGRDEGGRAPVGPTTPDEWGKAKALNESLAAWMELEFARAAGDQALADLVWAYIRAGPYPDWPYAGAERLERLEYQRDGLPAVRAYTHSLRQHPEQAQETFDRAPAPSSTKG